MSLTQEPIECPICYDEIGNKNNITTECGHQFHASCLMKNITRNGFGCPCCRTVMAEAADDDESEMPGLIDSNSEDDSVTEIDERNEDREPFSDDALRGLRLLTNLLEGEEHDQLDVVAEYQYNDEEEADVLASAPPREMIERCLRDQGITYEQLVAWILIDHQEYDDQVEELERFSYDLWRIIRTMINNYTPEESPIVVPEPELEAPPAAVEAEPLPSPIPDNDDDIYYEIEMAQHSGFYITERRRRVLPVDDLDDLRVDLAPLLIDYEAQPKMPMIHV